VVHSLSRFYSLCCFCLGRPLPPTRMKLLKYENPINKLLVIIKILDKISYVFFTFKKRNKRKIKKLDHNCFIWKIIITSLWEPLKNNQLFSNLDQHFQNQFNFLNLYPALTYNVFNKKKWKPNPFVSYFVKTGSNEYQFFLILAQHWYTYA